MIFKNGKVLPTYPKQFDNQLHSIEWLTPSGKWKRIWDAIYPIQFAEVLDDTLDYGAFQFINEELPYPDDNCDEVPADEKLRHLKQFTPIRMLWDSTDTCAEDESKVTVDEWQEQMVKNLKNPVNNPVWKYQIVDEISFRSVGRLYEFTVKTVEGSKLLERETCDTMTFTNKLGHNYSECATPVYPTNNITPSSNLSYVVPTMFSPQPLNGRIYIPAIVSWATVHNGLNWVGSGYFRVVIVYPSSRTEIHNGYTHAWLDFNELGTYTIDFGVLYSNSGTSGGHVIYQVEVVEDIPKKPYISMSDCFERVVKFGKTRRENVEKQRFFIDEQILDKYKNMRAPEFHITRATMWEALKTIAGHIHFIPRLLWNEKTKAFDTVTLDELGANKKCKLKAIYNNSPIVWDLQKKSDSYCGQIESYVDNLVNTQDFDQGTVIEPYSGGWISARASDGQIEVKDDTVRIRLNRPGYRVSRLAIRYNGQGADITPYLYEEAEYSALSNFLGSFPQSTAYALRYVQGGNEISELNHSSKSGKAFVYDAFNKEAIINIALAVGVKGLSAGNLKDIQYQVTYAPIVSARIMQKKSYVGDTSNKTMFYNASANLVESSYYGEHLKGAIARLGNDIEIRTYAFLSCHNIPKVGELLDGLYISKVITEITSPLCIKATLWLAKDYNQKNEHIAIDSNLRFYDVSEKQSVDRHVNYGENVIIGDEMGLVDVVNSMISLGGVEIFRKCLHGSTSTEEISWSVVQGTSKAGKEANKVILSCLSQALGNSIMFNFACKDNYGAGYQITNAYTINSTFRTSQTLVPYGNAHGEFETMHLRLGNYATLGKNATECEQRREALPTKLPEWSYDLPNGLLSTGGFPLLISKDSRECLNFTYQLHFVANRRGIVIGSALGQNNPLVTNNKGKQATCYLLDEPLNKFADYVDLSTATKIISGYLPNTAPLTEKKFHLPKILNSTMTTKQAVAWVDESIGGGQGKLIIGENIEIAPGESSKEIWFSFPVNF